MRRLFSLRGTPPVRCMRIATTTPTIPPSKRQLAGRSNHKKAQTAAERELEAQALFQTEEATSESEEESHFNSEN